jgi:HAE1 family hydrophobic/amphiphilic exporter-1
MFSKFFIYRPVFALVISIVISLLGVLAIPNLPIENTPDITPPTVQVSTSYPGASAAVVAETVAVPIEQKVNGVENMIYLSSKSADDGSMNLTVTFDIGTDIDMATVMVQNRVSQAEPSLPEETKRQGIITEKQSTAIVLMVNLQSPDGRYDEIYLSNYININIADQLARVAGVAKVQVFGAKDYGMRIWMDPEKLRARSLTTTDVVNAIREQNVQVAAGQIGAPPAPSGQQFQYTVNTQGRLSDPTQFEDMIVRVSDDGRIVRVRDVARVELGAQAYNWYVQLNGAPSIAMGIYQLPGSNALEVADGVRAMMDEVATRFPEGLEYRIAYDQTRFITTSIAEVIETLLIAILLVILTVYVFLQDIRTTIVPSITIPVSLLGTFGVMLAMGMSINTLTLFGLVLAIGIVVDDAIVVVENTMRIIDEEGLGSKEATAKAMEQVSGPVVATTAVLLAVFVPTAMMGGITGRLYSQFAITISVATVFSSLNALTLSPALCGILLRPSPRERNIVFRAFNSALETLTGGYMGIVHLLIRRVAIAVIIMAALVVALGWGFNAVPGGFLPDEDQGYIMGNITLPDGASLERTEAVLNRFNEMVMAHPAVADVITIGGYSLLDSLVASNSGAAFIVLKPWEERPGADQHAIAVAGQLTGQLQQFQEGFGFVFIPPPITGLGSAGGFEFQLQDRGNLGSMQLQTLANDLVFNGTNDPGLTRLNNSFRASVPQLYLVVDRTKARTLGIPLDEIFGSLQAYLGSAYVNDFNLFGRTYRVMIQADAQFRNRIEDISRLEVRDRNGNMIPLGTLLSVEDTVGPQAVTRYNLYPSANITGSAAPGFSSGEAIATMERLADQNLPNSMGYEWTGVTYQQLVAGNQAPMIFGLAAIMVFLFLAAQYESWFIPISVMSFIPVALLGAILGTLARGFDNNIYTQIGLVLLIGLAAKTAILIVEFAKQMREEGKSIQEAASIAARLRFRPVLMTAFSFILGVIPLVIASGAGAGSRQALGTAVFSGFLIATVLGVFLIPAFYVLVQLFTERVLKMAPEITPPASGTSAAALILLALLSAGCVVGPDYVAPEPVLADGRPMPDAWHTALTTGLETGDATLETWWQTFDDPMLTSLIERAGAQNLNTQAALSRIYESRYLLAISRSEELPTVNAQADYQIGEASEAQIGPDGEVAGLANIGATASWEVDLFGRIARQVESSSASYEATVEDYRDVLVSLYSEVALSYLDVRALQARIAAAQANAQSQRESLRIADARFNAGITSLLDVEQAKSNLADTEASIPTLEAALNFALNRLAVILATPPGSLHDELTTIEPIPIPARTVIAGIPADLLRQRPDIRRAERQLAAQTAQIGVATADLYPTFSISGMLSFQFAEPGDGSGLAWSLFPGVSMNLFNRDAIRNNIQIQEARTEQLFLFYEDTVLRAMEDVENAFIAYAMETVRRDRLVEAVTATRNAVDIVNVQYLSGLANFQNVLDTERSLFRLQDELATSEGLLVQDLVGLYSALGGGWRPEANEDPTIAADATAGTGTARR